MMSQHCTGSHMADVHTALRMEGQPASWLCSGTPYSFQHFPSTVYFEDRAKNYSALTNDNFIKQVSQTVGQRWLTALPWKCRSWCSRLGTLTSYHIRLCCVQISCLPEKGRLENYQVIIFSSWSTLYIVSHYLELCQNHNSMNTFRHFSPVWLPRVYYF